jgi:hypothetical protein
MIPITVMWLLYSKKFDMFIPPSTSISVTMLAVSEILDSLDDVSREFNQQTTSSAEYIEFKVRSLWLCATKGKTSVFCLLSFTV